MLRHLPPIVSVLVLLLVARQIYPYSSFNTPTVGDGFDIEVVATNLGGPTCLEWFDDSTLIVCDRDRGQIYALDLNMSKTVLVDDLDRPHDVAITDSHLFVSEAGKLSRYAHDGQLGEIGNKTTLISNVPTGNHQTNAVNILPNGTLVWHSGSTCNICVEDDPRNGALLWVNGSTGEHGILASGVRNSFDGTWVAGIGYVFTDNGRDWEGDHPDEELNLLPKAEITAGQTMTLQSCSTRKHCSTNVDATHLNEWRCSCPANSPLPGGNSTIYVTVYGS